MVYGNSGNSDINMDIRSNKVGYDNWTERTNSVLNSVSDSYSKLDISSVCASCYKSETLGLVNEKNLILD